MPSIPLVYTESYQHQLQIENKNKIENENETVLQHFHHKQDDDKPTSFKMSSEKVKKYPSTLTNRIISKAASFPNSKYLSKSQSELPTPNLTESRITKFRPILQFVNKSQTLTSGLDSNSQLESHVKTIKSDSSFRPDLKFKSGNEIDDLTQHRIVSFRSPIGTDEEKSGPTLNGTEPDQVCFQLKNFLFSLHLIKTVLPNTVL